MSFKITIIRHAPTEYNYKGIFMGSLDIPPAPFDEKAVSEIRKQLQRESYTKMYASPLKRAFETAREINNDVYNIVIDDRLRERNLGEWEGCTKDVIKENYSNAFHKGIMDFYYLPPNGESYEKLIKRVSSFLVDVYCENTNILIVTHNGVFRVIKSLITGERLSNVFSQFEPYLNPTSFIIDKELINRIKQNPFYTVD